MPAMTAIRCEGLCAMERKLMDRLLAWKDDAHRRPLVLRGARQTGKTWLLEEFGRRAFRSTVRIDFMREPALQGLFAKDLDPARIVSEIEIVRNTSIDPATTLLFFDEVQEAARGLTAFKYFCEDAPEYHVVAAGSYMGIAMRKGDTSFPTGKVTLLTLHPMDFIEFLRGIGDTQLADYVIFADGATFASMGKVLQSRLVDRLRTYLVVGGMPAAVSRYAEAASVRGVRDVQTDITEAYVADFAKHAPARILERMRLVWASLPAQLAKENKRFVFGALRRGARARDFEESIQWLEDFGAVIRVPRASALRIPLAGYEDRAAFKLVGVDVGLLGAQSGLPEAAILDEGRAFTEFKGSLTEAFVVQELVCAGLKPYYWSSPDSRAEIGVVTQIGARPTPIEVKAAESLRSKSLGVVAKRFGLDRVVRTSLSGYRDEGWMVNVPLWAVGQLGRLL